jgi:hypothetical protein
MPLDKVCVCVCVCVCDCAASDPCHANHMRLTHSSDSALTPNGCWKARPSAASQKGATPEDACLYTLVSALRKGLSRHSLLTSAANRSCTSHWMVF